MEHFLMYAVLAIVGLCMGSFAGAQVWRLRARQLVQDKAEGEKVDEKEYKSLVGLTKVTAATDRSRCLHCGHTLAWYDMLPLISWIGLRGKCRYCHKKIGGLEPLIELGMAVFFVGSYLVWPDMLQTVPQLLYFGLWLVAGVLLAILFVYDLKWFLLPNYVVFPLIGVGAVMAAIHVFTSIDPLGAFITLSGSVAILSGLYWVLWRLSNGQWIGFGDVKLGLALALIVGEWPLAFITLFAANLIGCVLVIPGLLMGKITRKTHVPFGPLLILGAIVAMLVGQQLIDWYFTAFV